ncbi:MAG: VanZ family protein [Aquabacterium sp.]|nr:VanZ family protein [Aquabacterium sp.]
MSGAHPPATLSAARSLRHLLGWVLLSYAVFVIYGSLVPLNFQPIPWADAWLRFSEVPMLSLGLGSRADLVANLLLFIPLAFLLRERLTAGRPPGVAATLGLWLGCSLLAVALEFTQVFFPGRTVSQNDIAAESAGAALGLCLHAARGPHIRRWLQGWWNAEQGLPFAQRLLHGYLVLMLVFALMPLDLSLSPADIFHKWRQGRLHWLPLSDLPADAAQVAYGLLTDVVIWIPVGMLWRSLGHTVRQVLVRGLLVSAVLEVLQLFVFTRVSSTTDVLSGALGCGIGALVVPTAWRQAAAPAGGAREAASPAAGQPTRWAWLSLAWALAVLAAFWFPYQFDWSPAGLSAQLQQALRLPFVTYYAGSEYHALNELLRKMLMFGPGGLLWAAHVASRPIWRRRALWGWGALAALSMALLVEAGQLLLPGKVADLTDVALQAGGAWLGMAIGRRLWGQAAVAAAVSTPALPASARRPTLSGGWFDVAVTLLLAAVLWPAAGLAGVPYNVAELMPRSAAGVGTALALATVAWSLLALPLLLQAHWRARPERAMGLVLWLPLLCLAPALLLVAAAPRESLDDVVGSPVLGGPPWLELTGRYMALHGALLLASIGAVWLVSRVASDRRIDLLPRWLIALMAWALPLHAAVVSWAATDNLTELMRDGGSLGSSSLLFIGVLALFTAASSLSALVAGVHHARRLMVLAALSWPVAVAALWIGSEHSLFKYGRVFSAAQFLLSPNRDHYAQGPELLARFALACVGLFGLAALLQWPRWRDLRRVDA